MGAIVADTQAHAQRAAKAVKISYEELQPVIVTIQVCIYSTFTCTLTTANIIFWLWNNGFVMCGGQNPNATQLASSKKVYIYKTKKVTQKRVHLTRLQPTELENKD